MSNIDTIPLGCLGNQKNELKLLLPMIKPQIMIKLFLLSLFVVHQ